MEKTVKEKIVDYAIEMISRLVITIAYAFVYGIIIYFLWNWLMPKFFGLQHATFWQACGLSFLSSAFFKDLSVKKESVSPEKEKPKEETERENHPYAHVRTRLKSKNSMKE